MVLRVVQVSPSSCNIGLGGGSFGGAFGGGVGGAFGGGVGGDGGGGGKNLRNTRIPVTSVC